MIKLGSSLINSLDSRKYPLKRTSGGEYVDGIWQSTGDENLEVKGSVQPLTGREIQRIPEGRRNTERKKIYTGDLLQPGESDTLKNADEITIDGDIFQVETVEPWNGHYKAMLVWKGNNQ